MSDRENSYSTSRKRRRPALSCEQCRRRKVRCDREMPCGPCKKVYGSMDCSYVHEGRAALNARRNTSRADANESLAYAEAPQGTADDTSNGANGARIAQMECTIRELQDRVKSLEHSAPTTPLHPQRTCVNGSNGRLVDREGQLASNGQDGTRQPQTLIAPLAPRLKGAGEKTKLFGTTHWAIVFQQVIQSCQPAVTSWKINYSNSFVCCVRYAARPRVTMISRMKSAKFSKRSDR